MAWFVPLIAAGLSAAGQAISSRRQAKQSEKNLAAQNRANRELAEYTYSKNLEMWERQNEYNSPANQMARFKAAGLNPNLIYGQGTPGNAQSLPAYSQDVADHQKVKPFDPTAGMPDALATYQSVRVNQEQVQNMRLQRHLIHQNILKSSAETLGKNIDNLLKDETYGYQVDKAREQARKTANENQLLLQRLQNMTLEEQLKELDIAYRGGQLGLQAQEFELRSGKITLQQLDAEQKTADLLYSRLRNEWMKAGVTTSDNVLLRLFVRHLYDQLGGADGVQGFIKELFHGKRPSPGESTRAGQVVMKLFKEFYTYGLKGL